MISVLFVDRCLNSFCNLVSVNDGGISEIHFGWLFVGPLDVKEKVRPYAVNLINEQR